MICDIGKETDFEHKIDSYLIFFSGKTICKKCADEQFKKMLEHEVR